MSKSNFPEDFQSDDGTTTTDGAASFSASLSSRKDEVVLWTFNEGASLINYLSPEGALALGRALVAEAHAVMSAQVEAQAAEQAVGA